MSSKIYLLIWLLNHLLGVHYNDSVKEAALIIWEKAHIPVQRVDSGAQVI